MSTDSDRKVENTLVNDPILQYIVVRGDLNWPVGSLMANASHASVAAIFQNLDADQTQKYLSDLERMHKVVLKADNIESLERIEMKLKNAHVKYHKWIERPEMIPSALATAPYNKSFLKNHFKSLKLFL